MFSIPACFSCFSWTTLPIIWRRGVRRAKSHGIAQRKFICIEWADFNLTVGSDPEPITAPTKMVRHAANESKGPCIPEDFPPFSSSGARVSAGWAAETRERGSDEGRIFALSHLLPVARFVCVSKGGGIARVCYQPLKGMRSINRTEIGFSLVSSTKSRTSELLRPLITTTFNLTLSSFGEASAVSRVQRIKACPGRRVTSSNLKGSRVSKLD
jgi:hypothetical protein